MFAQQCQNITNMYPHQLHNNALDLGMMYPGIRLITIEASSTPKTRQRSKPRINMFSSRNQKIIIINISHPSPLYHLGYASQLFFKTLYLDLAVYFRCLTILVVHLSFYQLVAISLGLTCAYTYLCNRFPSRTLLTFCFPLLLPPMKEKARQHVTFEFIIYSCFANQMY